MTKILVCPLGLREMMHVFYGFWVKQLCAEILRFRALLMPYYHNFMASPRLVSQPSQACLRILKFERVTLRVLKC